MPKHSHHRKHLAALGAICGLLVVMRLLQARELDVGRLPGDVFFAVAEYNLYFPVTTTVIVSGIFNLTAYLMYSLTRHYFVHLPAHRAEEAEAATDLMMGRRSVHATKADSRHDDA